MAKGFKKASDGLNGSEKRNSTTEASEPLSSKLKISMGTDEHASLGKTEYTPPEHTPRMESETEYTHKTVPEPEYTSSYTPAYAPVSRKKGKIIAGIAAVVFCAVAVVGLCFTMKQSGTGISEPINEYSGEATTDTYTESYTGNTSTGNTSTGYRTVGKPVASNSKANEVFSFYSDSSFVGQLAEYSLPNGFKYKVPTVFLNYGIDEYWEFKNNNIFSYDDDYEILIFQGNRSEFENTILEEWNMTRGEYEEDLRYEFEEDVPDEILKELDIIDYCLIGDVVFDVVEGVGDEIEILEVLASTRGEIVRIDNYDNPYEYITIGYNDQKTMALESMEIDRDDNTACLCISKRIDDGDNVKVFIATAEYVDITDETENIFAQLEYAARNFN